MQQFGRYLQDNRRERGIRLEDVAHTTRIPERSLRFLEAGDIDKLPGDVFVRGFVRAYAEFVGFDPDEALAEYTRASKERDSATDPGESDESEADAPAAEAPRAFFPATARDGEESKRGPVTLAVIILVIVATLTMSYLLRTPSASSDGITGLDDTSEAVG